MVKPSFSLGFSCILFFSAALSLSPLVSNVYATPTKFKALVDKLIRNKTGTAAMPNSILKKPETNDNVPYTPNKNKVTFNDEPEIKEFKIDPNEYAAQHGNPSIETDDIQAKTNKFKALLHRSLRTSEQEEELPPMISTVLNNAERQAVYSRGDVNDFSPLLNSVQRNIFTFDPLNGTWQSLYPKEAHKLERTKLWNKFYNNPPSESQWI